MGVSWTFVVIWFPVVSWLHPAIQTALKAKYTPEYSKMKRNLSKSLKELSEGAYFVSLILFKRLQGKPKSDISASHCVLKEAKRDKCQISVFIHNPLNTK